MTQITPQMVISNEEFNELNALKGLLIALNIPNPNSLSIGQIIRIRRALEGLSAKELAEKTGLDRGHLNKLENDDTDIRMATLEKLDLAFGPNFSKSILTLRKTTR